MRGTALRTGLVLFLMGCLVAAAVLGRAPDSSSRSGSALSSDPYGRRAAWLLLEELGFDVRVWTREPGQLPSHGLLLTAKVPPPPLPEPPRSGGDASGRLRDPRHYARFVEEGGVLVVHATEELVAFVTEELELVEPEALQPVAGSPRVQQGWLGTGERLSLAWRPFEMPFDEEGVEVLVADAEERPLALAFTVGRGRLVVLGDDRDPFRNGRLDQGDHAWLLVRLTERFGRPGPVLFDEYALGLWQPTSPLDLALRPRAVPFTLHLCALFALIVWRLLRARAFPRDLPNAPGVHPADRARGFAGLLVTHRRFDLAGLLLRRGVLRRLLRRRGIREALETEPSEALVERAFDGGVGPEVRELFLGALPRSAGELEALGRALNDLESSN